MAAPCRARGEVLGYGTRGWSGWSQPPAAPPSPSPPSLDPRALEKSKKNKCPVNLPRHTPRSKPHPLGSATKAHTKVSPFLGRQPLRRETLSPKTPTNSTFSPPSRLSQRPPTCSKTSKKQDQTSKNKTQVASRDPLPVRPCSGPCPAPPPPPLAAVGGGSPPPLDAVGGGRAADSASPTLFQCGYPPVPARRSLACSRIPRCCCHCFSLLLLFPLLMIHLAQPPPRPTPPLVRRGRVSKGGASPPRPHQPATGNPKSLKPPYTSS
mmetsp:Transcript_41206/g.100553  ORF Transcript_41206/g.100553 Transcript_41206/m.100553 type:complete len:266 (-) Transcript_41206:7-804(-)